MDRGLLGQRAARPAPRPRPVLVAGFCVLIAGTLTFLIVLTPAVPAWFAVPIWGVTGFGMGLSYSMPSLIVLREAPGADQGAATAALQLSDVLGSSLGTGIGGALIAFGSPSGETEVGGLVAVFVLAAAVAVVGLVLTRRLGERVAAGRPLEVAVQATA